MSVSTKIGRLIFNEHGIEYKAYLFFFGRRFHFLLSQLTGWSYADQIIQNRNGKKKIGARCVEFHTKFGLKIITFSANDEKFILTLKELRRRFPHLETKSYLALHSAYQTDQNLLEL